jgi:outer membrane protein TolC
LDFKALNNYRAGNENLRAAQFSYRNARDLVVLVVGGGYMAALSGAARIESVQAQVKTAEALFRQAQDLKRAGITPGIDVLRAQVEFQAQQQRLLAVENEFAKQKLALARAIGLPIAQEYSLADSIPYAPLPPLTLEQALDRAYRERSDYQGAQALLRAAELSRKAALGGALPSLQLNADYGVIGPAPGNSHGTFTTAAALRVPIFQGGRVRAEVIQADALIRQRTAEIEDMRARIEFEVRTAFLDVNSAGRQVEVAQSSVEVARQQLTQAKDRFAAGVTNNIEVVQAQEALASADESYISALFAHNLAKLSLARSLGVAEEASKQFLGGNR